MKLAFIGDIMIGRLVNEMLKSLPPEYPWGNTLDLLFDADVRFCNLECVISDRGNPWSRTPKVFHFRSDTKNVQVLKAGRMEAVSLANNHSLDYEEAGLKDMLCTLDMENIFHAGAGNNIREAKSPVFFEMDGFRIGFIACTDNEPHWEADKNKPGIFYVPIDLDDRRAKELIDIIKETNIKVDILVVSVHWGPNWDYDTPQSHIDFAHTLVDAGADIIFGHSPHVFRGVEIYQDKPVFYSCGNFIDDYAVDDIERNDQSFIFNVEIKDNKLVSVTLCPTIISNFQARLATSQEASLFITKMQNLCEVLNTPVVWESNKNRLEIKIK